jgi:multiple antibiotic resistance protein
MLDQILYSTAALIALTNPLAELPFFLAATDGSSAAERRRAAVKVAVGVFGVLAVAAIAGGRILELFDLSFAAFRAAGGLVVILAGLEMLRGTGTGITSVRDAPGEIEDHLWVPLVMPLIAGPASITAAITLALGEPVRPAGIPVGTLAGVAVSSLVVLALLLGAGSLSERLHRRVIRVFERFSGLILVAVGFQMGLSGIQEFFVGGVPSMLSPQ